MVRTLLTKTHPLTTGAVTKQLKALRCAMHYHPPQNSLTPAVQ